MAAFSGIKLGWEPLLEPWQCRLQLAAPTGVPSTQHQRLSVSSTQGLELTVTQTALEAAALAGGALAAAAAVAADPSLLDAQLEASGSSAAYSAAYWLHNQTGSTLELWLAASEGQPDGGGSPADSPGSSSDGSGSGSSRRFASAGSSSAGSQGPWVPAGPPELVVRPGGRVALPVVSARGAQQQGLHVGRPSATQGVLVPHPPAAHQPHLAHSASSSRLLLPADSTPRLHQRHSGATLEGSGGGLAAAAAALQTRPLLYFRLAEHVDICGPLHLDRRVAGASQLDSASDASAAGDDQSRCRGTGVLHGQVPISADCPATPRRGCFEGCTACPGVLCDMSEARHGGYTLALHSGVRVRRLLSGPVQGLLRLAVCAPCNAAAPAVPASHCVHALVVPHAFVGTWPHQLTPSGAPSLPPQLRNTTQLALDIGVQTPMGLVMEPQALGTLRPGGTMWLPALRAHTGLLCLRPAASSAPALGAAAGPPPAPPPAPPSVAGGRPAGERLQTAATWQPGSNAGSGGSRMPLLAADSLAAAAALVAGSQGGALPTPPQRMPSSPLLYSTAGLASPQRGSLEAAELHHRQPGAAAGAAAPAWHPYEWSVAVSLQTLLRQAAGAEAAAAGGSGRGPTLERGSGSKKLTCEATSEQHPPVLLCMGASRLAGGDAGGAGGRSGAPGAPVAALAGGAAAPPASGSWEVLLSAPLVLHNALPVPVDVSLVAYGLPHRLALQPNQQAALHAVDASAVDHVVLRALGYHPTRPFTPAPLPALASLADGSGSGAARQAVAPDTELLLQVGRWVLGEQAGSVILACAAAKCPGLISATIDPSLLHLDAAAGGGARPVPGAGVCAALDGCCHRCGAQGWRVG